MSDIHGIDVSEEGPGAQRDVPDDEAERIEREPERTRDDDEDE